MKEKIREFVTGLGVDDVGFAGAKDYGSPQSPALAGIMPGVRSLVVMAHREPDNCESDNMQIAFTGRMDVMEYSRSCNYRLARFLNRELGARAMSVPPSYPLHMSTETKGMVGDVSLRHAAVAAGLGAFGRNNLVVHPRFGSRVVFTAVLTDLELKSDPPAENVCNNCNACVDNCPVGALDEEGKTNLFGCIKNSQPYGIGGHIQFWNRFVDGSPDKQKEMVRDVHFWRLFQAGFIGFQYFCFNCMKSCPAGRNQEAL
jgi:epoxyqueuosine reductase QueG